MKFKKICILALVILTVVSIISCTNNNIAKTPAETLDNTIETTISATIESTLATEPTFTEATEPILFDESITFDSGYISDDEVMPYALYTPSSAANYEEIPLIVWLHGSGESGIYEEAFFKRGLPLVLNNWTLEGFNAYVLCPQLIGQWDSGSWNNPNAKDNLRILIDKFINEYNVDTDKIIITGHSLGGQGALYMAHQLPEYFSKLVMLSGYPPNINIAEILIPAIGYVGQSSYGEDFSTIQYTHGDFANVFGEENVFSIATYHGNLPNAVFNEDKDGNNRSDVVEWMLSN